LLHKAAEPTAHVAGFGTQVGGLRPSDASCGFIDMLKKTVGEGSRFFSAVIRSADAGWRAAEGVLQFLFC